MACVDQNAPYSVRKAKLDQDRTTTTKRSIVKAITYRGCIVFLDFLFIYILTRKIKIALGFMIVSNIYTTIGYFVHERIWAHIKWGVE